MNSKRNADVTVSVNLNINLNICLTKVTTVTYARTDVTSRRNTIMIVLQVGVLIKETQRNWAQFKTFFMLSSAERKILSANKHENAKGSWNFLYLLAETFSCSVMLSKKEFAFDSDLRFINRTNVSCVEHEKSFIISSPRLLFLFIVPRLFEEKWRDTAFGFPWGVVRGAWFRVFSRYFVPLTPPTVSVRSF